MTATNISSGTSRPLFQRYASDDYVNAFVLGVLWHSFLFGNPFRPQPDAHELMTPDQIRSAAIYQFGELAAFDIKLTVN